MENFFSIFSFASEIEEEKRIRVGYIDYAGFIENIGLKYSGYGVEYLEEISKYTNWNYDYVYDTWENHLEALKKGTIDILCTAQYTEERSKNFEYSSRSIGMEQGILYVNRDNDAIYYNDFKAFQNMKVGVLKNSFQTEAFRAFAKKQGFSYREYDYNSDYSMAKALADQEIDAIAVGSLSLHKELKAVAKFGSEPFYIISKKGNHDLMAQINWALDEIRNDNPYFEADLNIQYYSDSALSTFPLFTRQEQQFIENSDVFTVGCISNRTPIAAYDSLTKEFSGITMDILAQISKISGLKFEYMPVPKEGRTIERLKKKAFDISAGVVKNRIFLSDPELTLSKPFLSGSLVMVTQKGTVFDPHKVQTITIPYGFQSGEAYIKTNYPNYKILTYTENEECLQAVLTGKADIMMQNSYVVSNLLNRPQYENLEIIPTFFEEELLTFAVRSDSDPLLISILNKTISTLDETNINQIVVNHTIAEPYQMSFTDFLYKYRYTLILVGLLLVVYIFTITGVFIQRQNHLKLLEKKNEELTKAIAAAEQASASKSMFLSKMSHEIRTPMNAMIGMTIIVGKYLDDTNKIKEYLSKISFSSRILLNIINDILDMSAIENNKIKISNTMFDFKQMMTSIASMYYEQCKQKGITFDLILNHVTQEFLMGDALRVNQILFNLLSNALKFTEPGGSIRLIVTELKQTSDQMFYEFTVKDTGCGMSKEFLNRIFEPFEQESSLTVQSYGGSGLGLAITKNLIDMMKGSIRVESEQRKGSTFTITLSFGIPENQEITAPNHFGFIQALVIDDDPESCNYTSAILNHLKICHDCTNSPAKGLELIEAKAKNSTGYDICFIDWKIPHPNAIDLTKLIRNTLKNDAIIVIVSAYDLNEIEKDAKHAGANLFISKPLFQSSVFDLLMTLSDNKYKTLSSHCEKYDFSGKKVLLVEDTEFNMEVAFELLQMTGLSIDCAENGKIAVDKFLNAEPGTYDLILMDIQMPEMNGYDATRTIRASAHPDSGNIPIIAMTANAFTEDVLASLSAGMNNHISKPIDTEVLYQTLQIYFTPPKR